MSGVSETSCARVLRHQLMGGLYDSYIHVLT